MAIPLQVCLSTVSVAKLVTNTAPLIAVAPAVAKIPGQYTCFTTVAVHKTPGGDWVVQNMPIHRWLLDKVFDVSYLDAVGLTIANTKQLQRKPLVAPTPRQTQNKTATIPVTLPKRGSKARQGKKIRFGLTGTAASSLSGAITARTAPKSFGKSVVKGASILMPSRCTNPQIGAWFATHMTPARLSDIRGAIALRSNGTAIGIKNVSLPADFALQFEAIPATYASKLQDLADAPVVEY